MQLRWAAALLLAALLQAGCEGSLAEYPTDDAGVAADRGKAGTDVGGSKKKDLGAKPDKKAQAPDTGGGKTYPGKPGEFVKQAAGRTYRLFVPSGYTPAKAIPLVIGFHGAGDSGGNFYSICKYTGWTSAAGPANFILLVPDTKSPYKDFAIWTGNPNNDGPAMKKEMAEILSIVTATAKTYRVDLKRVHAFGFSDGGLFVGVTGMANAARFASLSVMGYGWGSSYPLYTPSRKIPAQFVCGTGDSFAAYAQKSYTYLQGKGHPTRFLSASGVGHKFSGLMSSHAPSKLFSWMSGYKAP